MKQKKSVLLIAMIAICLSLGMHGTTAYFTSDDIATNVITAGNISIDLQEQMTAPDGDALVVFENRDGVMPGTEASKIVTVTNTGDQPVYIRIMLSTDIALPDEGAADPSLLSFDMNTDAWAEQDGCWYCRLPLNPGETTEPLFTKVLFSAAMDNRYQTCRVTVTVLAQATQVKNNGSDALTAVGWPDAQ